MLKLKLFIVMLVHCYCCSLHSYICMYTVSQKKNKPL